MAKRTVIPFGPHHPVLPEPVHLDLVLEDETVVEAIPNVGFIHRGLEMLCKKKPFQDIVLVAERICGICSMIHGVGFSQGVEKVMDIDVPPRAEYLRAFWGELSRVHSHILWLGLAADAIGFESLFMHSWRVREMVLDIFEETTGGRVIFDVCKIGGVRKDIENEILKNRFSQQIDKIEEEYSKLAKVFTEDYTVCHRWSNVGVLTKEDAHKLGAVGPTVRGSGISQDMRTLKYGAYEHLDFEPVVENSCDCYARTVVRVKEVFQSIDLMRQVISKIPDGEVETKVKGTPKGEYFSRVEQPRGEVVYYVKGDGTKNLDRFRVRTPTFANIPPLLQMLGGCDLADVPAIVISIDPCISCTER
ncbi:MAG: nickel-dependent hydrogenase large subunit [Victivallales bacterium]|nr:nickel-dependent hydrogenase large subunit [Victivallales bacterium]MCF7888539.1 nickel-dependent hydrogenase large subunit [Victivallales bacterium]